MPLRLPVVARNPLSLIGMAIATAMAMLFLALLLLEWIGLLGNPYIGLLQFVAVPAIFIGGLLLIPLGAWRTRRRRRLHPELTADWPVLDLRDPHQRTVAVAVLALTLVNLLIVSVAAFGGVHYMETSSFCGQVCHTTMQPEFEAHEAWPHARVECVQCHVGSGAGGFVESKLSGSRRLLHVVTGNIPTPVPAPVTSMPPARDTCEQCHWSENFHGDKTKVIREYANDEANSETTTTLQLHVGSGSRTLARGIHWHMNPDNQIEYVASDDKREVIPYVRLTDRNGKVSEFVVDGTPAAQRAAPRRLMDCLDCHNRPAHTFSPAPERAVDAAITAGQLPRELPFVRREAVAALGASYADRETALAAIARRLGDFYRQRPGVDARLIARAVAGSQDLWSHNVFPGMKVSWGTYPNLLGHVDVPGCFRCHDDEHKTKDGRAISQDCELCHVIQ